jgi:hypothetical protein
MMLLTPYSFYINGKHINYKKAIKLISRYFDHPIVVHTDILVNIPDTNIIGGKVTDAKSQGEIVANKVLKYFNGEFMENLGFTFESANKLYLNVDVLRKFGVDAYKLSDNAIFINDSEKKDFNKMVFIFTLTTTFLVGIIVLIVYKFYQTKINAKRSLNIKEYYKFRYEALKNLIDDIFIFIIDRENPEFTRRVLKELISRKRPFEVKRKLEYIADMLNSIHESTNYKVDGEEFLLSINPLHFVSIIVMILDKLKNNENVEIFIEKTIDEKNVIIRAEIDDDVFNFAKKFFDVKKDQEGLIIVF